MQQLLSMAIFFCLLQSTTRADREEVITDDDLKAFEAALADLRHRGRADGSAHIHHTELNRRFSLRSRRLNHRLQLTTTQAPQRKRDRQRSHLRRLLQKSDESAHRRFSAEQDIERVILQALKETSNVPPTVKTPTVLSFLRQNPSVKRGELIERKTTLPVVTTTVTTPTESTTTVPLLEELIAELEGLEPRERTDDLFIDEPPPSTTTLPPTTSKNPTTTSRRRTIFPTSFTTTSTTKATTTSLNTIEKTTSRRSKLRGSSFKIGEDGPVPPTITPTFAEEARRMSLEIENNFVDIHEGPDGPLPPSSHPPASHQLTAHFAPPGAEPPSDQIVLQLNAAEDFIAVAKKLQLGRRKGF